MQMYLPLRLSLPLVLEVPSDRAMPPFGQRVGVLTSVVPACLEAPHKHCVEIGALFEDRELIKEKARRNVNANIARLAAAQPHRG